ncbi:ExbD/TolR family protein [sulfur-oxidizing endosymbiont of Gigantopelta aegis]|uniref:ExbD/TolR family protein n=1 Tax=sulfur-oxidizing endosymbiont of Gigantopelta aegis TaxID=2794934 RepID=UPI0018DC12DE|nr:biopolymer transporter ExbD [sulfur-oxidizing endosymbiont of Gigantopelta aegis]
MRKRHINNPMKRPVNINLTPMIDMVFILLIFFIVTTSFVKETGVEINRPTAKTAERHEQGNILVAITKKGTIWIDRRQVETHSVRANIERLKAQNPEGSVIIQADAVAQTGVLIKVIDQVRLAGISNISIAASKP